MLAVVVELPSPAAGRSAPSSKRTRQPIGADRMGAPIRIYREPRRRRHERAAECPRQNRGWKSAWQCPIEARERLTISFCLFRLPFGHLRPPIPTAWCHRSRKVFVTYLRRSRRCLLGSKAASDHDEIVGRGLSVSGQFCGQQESWSVWHLTDVLTLSMSAFRGKADIPSSLANVR